MNTSHKLLLEKTLDYFVRLRHGQASSVEVQRALECAQRLRACLPSAGFTEFEKWWASEIIEGVHELSQR
jgi:hypothetical protein